MIKKSITKMSLLSIAGLASVLTISSVLPVQNILAQNMDKGTAVEISVNDEISDFSENTAFYDGTEFLENVNTDTIPTSDGLLTEELTLNDNEELPVIENNSDGTYSSIMDDIGKYKDVEKNTSGLGATNITNGNNEINANIKNGWIKEDGGYKYYKNGKAYTGWHMMGIGEGEKTTHWSYFGSDGKIYTGWHNMGKKEGEKTAHWSYFGHNGWLRTGWVRLGKADGEKTEHWSYFGGNGWLRTGWVQLGKADGEKVTHWSYFGDNGWLRTGWVQLGKGTSEPDNNSARHWSYFGGNGWLQTGWKHFTEKDGEAISHWSYFGNNGWLRTGWVELGKGTSEPDNGSARHWSYFGLNGWLRTGLQKIDGVSYSFDSNGWLRVKTIVVDPGHQRYSNSSLEPIAPGSSETKAKVSSGTQGIKSLVPEYVLNLTIGLKLKTELQNRGYNVIMTRETNDIDISNIQRAQIANNNNADALVHIHANSSTNSSISGCLTICPTSYNKNTLGIYKKCYSLSECVLKEYSKATGFKETYIWQTDNMTGLNWSKVPVTTIEMGYMSNPSDDMRMQDPVVQGLMVKGIANGIDSFFSK